MLPSFAVDYLRTFPYCLPNIIVGLIVFGSLLLAFFTLSETHKGILAKKAAQQAAQQQEKQRQQEENEAAAAAIELNEQVQIEVEIQGDDNTAQQLPEIKHKPKDYDKFNKRGAEEEDETPLEEEENQSKLGKLFKWWPKNEILRTRAPLLACLMYGFVGLLQIMTDESTYINKTTH